MAGIIVLLVNVAAVLFMSGTIWVRQIVYYPLYAFVGVEAFPAYQRENGRRVERIIQPSHAAMALSSLLLLFVRPALVRWLPLAWCSRSWRRQLRFTRCLGRSAWHEGSILTSTASC
jgi:site-specific recombinase